MKLTIRLFSIILLLSSTLSLRAQLTSYEAYLTTYFPEEYNGGVVRHWKGDCNVICFYSTSSSRWFIGFHRVHHFLASSYTSDALTCFSVPAGLSIKDLYVVGDTTYLCGALSGRGVYGWFRNDTTGSSLNYDNLTLVAQVDTLNKLVVRRDASGKMHLTAIGVHHTTGRHCILEAADATAPKAQSYNLAFVNDADGTHDEVLDDVLLTDKFVVFVSRDKREGVGPVCFRYSDPTNVLGDPLVNTHYRMQTTQSEVLYTVAATPTEEDQFAIAYPNEAYVEARIHRLIVSSGITLLSSQQTAVCGAALLEDMTYHKQTGKLTLLWPDVYYDVSSFLTFSPYSNGTQPASHIQHPRVRCHSIDDMDGQAFVASGGNGVTIQRSSPLSDNCPLVRCMACTHDSISSYQGPTIVQVKAPLKMTTYNATTTSSSENVTSYQPFRYCKAL